MVKTILLKCDEDFFYKLKADKLKREKLYGSMTWEDYVLVLFGFKNGGKR